MRFFVGVSPSQASGVGDCMVSYNSLRDRRSDFSVGEWILDSGAFTEISRFGEYRHSCEEYFNSVVRWARCGRLLAAVSQDFMCESFILSRWGRSVRDHQSLTVARYVELSRLFDGSGIYLMPVLQGFRVSEYLECIQMYGDALEHGAWVGVGSVCRRSCRAEDIADILSAIRVIRPDLRLHGFGLKLMAFADERVRDSLFSADSMAWSVGVRWGKNREKVRNHQQPEKQIFSCDQTAISEYQTSVKCLVDGGSLLHVPRTAGAGNGQGRKRKWVNDSCVVRIPAVYRDRVLALCHDWEKEEVGEDGILPG